jgi:hypothetical protein
MTCCLLYELHSLELLHSRLSPTTPIGRGRVKHGNDVSAQMLGAQIAL